MELISANWKLNKHFHLYIQEEYENVASTFIVWSGPGLSRIYRCLTFFIIFLFYLSSPSSIPVLILKSINSSTTETY